MKSNAPELPRIREDQHALLLKENEMIMFARPIIRGSDVNFASHAKMNSKPVVAGKLEEHSFTAPVRAKKLLANQVLAQRAHIGLAKDAVLLMYGKIDNCRAESGVPLFTKPFDLRQLGHRADYAQREMRSTCALC